MSYKSARFFVVIFLSLCIISCANNEGNPAPVAKISGKTYRIKKSYVVQSGDNINSVASKLNVNYEHLAAENSLSKPYNINAGQKLYYLQKSDSHDSKPIYNTAKLEKPVYTNRVYAKQHNQDNQDYSGDEQIDAENNKQDNVEQDYVDVSSDDTSKSRDNNLATTTQKENYNQKQNKTQNQNLKPEDNKPTDNIAVDKRVSTHNIENQSATNDVKNNKVLGKGTWGWPIHGGKIISYFDDPNTTLKGINIVGTVGSPIFAAGSGEVVYSGNALRGYGNLIIIKHNEKFLSAYAHNKEIIVKEGDKVKIGQQIATMGDSGAKSVMLHFEVRYDGKPIDPMTVLPKR